MNNDFEQRSNYCYWFNGIFHEEALFFRTKQDSICLDVPTVKITDTPGRQRIQIQIFVENTLPAIKVDV